jgi:ubiquinone/menaquinone biosynthesis C-methylase UbiE
MGSAISTLRSILFSENGRLRREYRRFLVNPLDQIARSPLDVGAWVDLIERERRAGRLAERAAERAASHQLSRRGPIGSYLAEIPTRAGAALRAAANDPVGNLPTVIEELIRWKTIIQCRETHAGNAGYFAAAEGAMEAHWRLIWPAFKDGDFTSVVELAPGHGRNTEYLRRHAKTIHLVDVNQSCLDACHARFGEARDGCRFFYHLTDGTKLQGVPDQSITFGYSWDAMVHFDKGVVREYIHEFARVLKRGATAFLHMSNYGMIKPDSDWGQNPGGRSDMTGAALRSYVAEAGLSLRHLRFMTSYEDLPESEAVDLHCVVVRDR